MSDPHGECLWTPRWLVPARVYRRKVLIRSANRHWRWAVPARAYGKRMVAWPGASVDGTDPVKYI
jgi:hypothetical protein